MNGITISLSKRDQVKERKTHEEIKEIKQRQRQVERRVGALQSQIRVIQRKISGGR